LQVKITSARAEAGILKRKALNRFGVRLARKSAFRSAHTGRSASTILSRIISTSASELVLEDTCAETFPTEIASTKGDIKIILVTFNSFRSRVLETLAMHSAHAPLPLPAGHARMPPGL